MLMPSAHDAKRCHPDSSRTQRLLDCSVILLVETYVLGSHIAPYQFPQLIPQEPHNMDLISTDVSLVYPHSNATLTMEHLFQDILAVVSTIHNCAEHHCVWVEETQVCLLVRPLAPLECPLLLNLFPNCLPIL
jgi:hypothetical protein